MSKVTADGMDVITEASGHSAVPMAPSVCTTPAAPAPIPVPYPITGSSAQGVMGAPSRTKIGGAKIGTVGGGFKAVHGNEPGTLKEVVSLATGGPAPILLGAPNVYAEAGMVGMTGSPVMANRGPGPEGRTAPAPSMAAASVPGVAVLGGGGANGDADGDGHGGKDGAGGGGSDGGDHGAGDGKSAPAGQPGQCSGSDPVDLVTGRAHTLPAVDLALPGPLPLVFARTYSSAAADRDVGLGFGWCHSWGWEIEAHRHALVIWSDDGTSTQFPLLDVGAEHVGPWGWTLERKRERYVLDRGDGVFLVFAAADDRARRWVLVELRDRTGNRIELTYDEEGRLAEVLDSAGRTIELARSRSGRIGGLHVRDAARDRWSHAARYAYDASGNLVAAFDAEGRATRYECDGEHRLTRKTDREGLSFCFVYDHRGRCVETWGEYPGKVDPSLAEDVSERLADGARARGVHHLRIDFGLGFHTEVSDSTQIRRYTGNACGLVEKAVDGAGVEETTYDARGLVLTEKDGEGAVTSYERDARGWVVRVIDPLGRSTTYERDDHGDVVRIVDPAGGVYQIQRDACGNVLHESEPTGGVWSYSYDARGLRTSATSPTGGVSWFVHDDAGNLVEQIEPTGGTWRWEYDLRGRRLRERDPLGHETLFVWTERGDLAAVHQSETDVTRYTYDGERRLVEVHGPGQRTLGLAWGGFGRLVQRMDAVGGVARFRYNREGELTEAHNELGELHRLRRNAAGLVTREETFDGRSISFLYDHARRVVRSVQAGEITLLGYDKAGHLTKRLLPDDTVETFAYDARGELERVTYPGGEIAFERDAVGRVLREVQSHGRATDSVELLYDNAGGCVRRSTSRGHVEHMERDAAGARTRTILDERYDVHHTRDPFGREVTRALPRGGRIQQEYERLGRLNRRLATSPGSLLPVRYEDPNWAGPAVPVQPPVVTAEREYLYNADGELSDALDRRRGWVQYDYEPEGHLLAVFHEATRQEEAFRYDAAGNPYEVDGDRETRTYGPGGRLLGRGEASYRWDEAGRLREKRTPGEAWRYAWDGAGRLAAVDLPDGRRAEYAYDPLGRRVETRLYDVPRPARQARLAERSRFVWDGDTLVHVIRTSAAGEGNPVVDERTFAFEDGSFIPWAQHDDTPDDYGGRRKRWLFFVNDAIGTPDELVGADGGTLAELDRQAWGSVRVVEGARAATPLRFQGQYEDGETGLFYNRFRHYDAEVGLYLSPDPIGLDGGLRLYGYGLNPLAWVDPLGLTGQAYDIALHEKQPSPRPTGLQSHHMVQRAWAGQNVQGYDPNRTRTMLLPKAEHKVISDRQGARACARVRAGHPAYSGTRREELDAIASDYDAAGIGEKHKRRAIKSAYRDLFP